MSDFSNYAEDLFTDWAMGKASMPATGTRYLAAYTAVTDAEAGTGTEVSGVGYARVAITASMSASSGGASANTAAVEFAVAGAGGWGTVSHVGVRDALTGGNPISVIKALTGGPVTIAENDVLRIPVGDLDFATQ